MAKRREKPRELKEDSIQREWGHLIEGAEGRSLDVFKKTIENIARLNWPHIHLRRRIVIPGERFMPGAKKKQAREFLEISNRHIEGYKFYLGTQDFGKQLFVRWYLVREPDSAQILSSFMDENWFLIVLFLPFFLTLKFYNKRIKKNISPSTTSTFDLEEVSAFISTVGGAIQESVAETVIAIQQESVEADRGPSGFIGLTENV